MPKPKLRTKKELVEMQTRLHKSWEKAIKEHRTTTSRWIALAYTLNTIDYVLGKLEAPPALGLIEK
jgi:hypothetical protein